jgi:hypothetical protein
MCANKDGFALFFCGGGGGGGGGGGRRWFKHLFALCNEDTGLIVGQPMDIDIQTMLE